jgi:Peptidase family M23
VLMQRRVGQNGNTIEVIPTRTIEGQGRLLIFNPLWQWPPDVPLERLDIALHLSSEDGESEIVKHTVTTLVQVAKQALQIPLDGDVFVHAAHDFTSHHRRFPLHSPMTDALQIRHNATRYAYDFAVVNTGGAMFSGEGKKLTDWFGYGSPVFAPAAGKIVEVHDGQPDNELDRPPRLDREAVMKNPKLLYGNYVLIDHGNAELSMLAHLESGSVDVRVGQQVRTNQRLGRIGMSGDASIVHLHYQMQSGRGFDAGIPVQFTNFFRKLGTNWEPARAGPVDEGEIVRAEPQRRQGRAP